MSVVTAANETGGERTSSQLVRLASARSAGHVRRLVAYRSSGPPTVQTEPPTGGMSLILSMGPSMRVRWAGAPSQRVRSFLVGFFDRPAETADEGDAWGVQIDLTAAGAFALLGTQVADVENHLLDADLLDGLQLDRLVDQLASCPSGAQRLATAERAVQDLLAAGPRLSAEVDWIERCLRADPTRRVRSLAAEVGWRGERLSQRFRQEVGVTPKTFARVHRFNRALALLRPATGPTSLAAVAYATGYADQAHFTREFHRLAGSAPTHFLATQSPSRPG